MESRTCAAEWLVGALADDRVLLIDCRPQSEFASGHVVGSINVSLPALLQRRLRKGNFTVACAIACNQMKEKFLQRSRTHDVVLYDSSDGDANANASGVLALLLETLTRDGCRAKMLLGGFARFQAVYPSLVTSECLSASMLGLNSLGQTAQPEIVPADSLPESTCPVEVIPRLFLGDAKNSADLQSLERYNIKYILNVTPNLPNQFQHNSSFKYKRIPVNDHWSQNVLAHFPEAIAFIDEGRAQGLGVLVHCLAGVSRSVTVTVAYLMARQSMSLNEAYDFVKRAKPNISPNFNFMGQLLDFEQAPKSGGNGIFPLLPDVISLPSDAGGACGPTTPLPTTVPTMTAPPGQTCSLCFAD